MITTIADGIATLLNDGTGEDEIIAVVDYVPDFNLKDLDERKIIIVPTGCDWDNLTRGKVSRTYVFEIGVLQRLSGESDIEDFCESVISIGDRLKNSMIGDYRCMMVETIQLYNPSDYKQSKKAVGVLRARYKGL